MGYSLQNPLSGEIQVPLLGRPMTKKLGLVVALPSEGRTLAGRCWQIVEGRQVCRESSAGGGQLIWVRSGIGYERAREAACWLVGQGVTALGVLGVSGGLSLDLVPGRLVVASLVVDAVDGGSGATLALRDSNSLLGALRRAGEEAVGGSIVTVAEPVLEPERKGLLGRRWGALAVDMESAAVARIAAEAGLGLFALRAICDPVERQVPLALYNMIDEVGGLRINVLLVELLRRPQLIIDLLAMQRDFSRALKTLRRGGRVVIKQVMSDLGQMTSDE
jgi:adenosylhomocysteine nucleosidase